MTPVPDPDLRRGPDRLALWIKLTGFVAGVALLIWLAGRLPIDAALHEVIAWVHAHPRTAFVAIILLMVAHNAIPVPAEAIALAAGATLGPVWGSLAVWCGAMIGAGLAFWMSRRWGHALVLRILPARHARRLAQMTQACTWRTLLGLRMIPVISFNLVNYGAGLTAVRWPLFLWTTALGILPVTVLSVCIGARLVDVSVEHAVIGLTVLGVALLLYKRVR